METSVKSTLSHGSRVPYLVGLALAVIVPGLLQYLWQYQAWDLPTIKGQPPGVWASFLLTGVVIVLWWMASLNRLASGWPTKFFLVLAALWVYEVVVSILHGDVFTHGVWLYPIVLLMLWLKAPSLQEATKVLVFLGWTFTVILVLARGLEMLEVIPTPSAGEDIVAFETANYWLPLSGWLGPEGRWVGPFFHNAQTGNIGAYLVVLGVALRRWSSIPFVLVGVLALLLTNSRSSLVASAIGVVVVLALGPYPWGQRIGRGVLTALVLFVGAIAALIALLASPNLTGRDAYWADYWDLWRSSPWIGVGVSGRNAGPDSIDFVNGHNLVIDALGIFGIFAAIAVVIILTIAVIVAIQSSLQGNAIPLGLVATYGVIGLTQSDYNWMATSNPWLVLTLAVLLGGAVLDQKRTRLELVRG